MTNFCFGCDKELEPAFGGSKIENDPQCSDAVMFSATGNYGSTLFDPISSDVGLLINICDECLKSKKDRVLLATVEKPLPIVSYTPWNPEEHYE